MESYGLPSAPPPEYEDAQQKVQDNAQAVAGIINSVAGAAVGALQQNQAAVDKVQKRLTNSVLGSIRRNQSVIQSTTDAITGPALRQLATNQAAVAGASTDPPIAALIANMPVPAGVDPPSPPVPPPTDLAPPPSPPAGGNATRTIGGNLIVQEPGGGTTLITPGGKTSAYNYQPPRGTFSSLANAPAPSPSPVTSLPPLLPAPSPPPVTAGLPTIPKPGLPPPPPPPPPGIILQPLPPPPPSPPLSPVTSIVSPAPSPPVASNGTVSGQNYFPGGGTTPVTIASGTPTNISGFGAPCAGALGPYAVPPPVPVGYYIDQTGSGYYLCPAAPASVPTAAPPPPPPPAGGTVSATQCPQTYTIVQGPSCPTFMAVPGSPSSWTAQGIQIPTGFTVISTVTDTQTNVQTTINNMTTTCIANAMQALGG